jgi:hypothetical protein
MEQNNIFTIEEEAFCLHLLDALEYIGAEKRLIKIVECLSENCDDIKTVLKKLRNYTKTIKSGEPILVFNSLNSFLKNAQVFDLIVQELHNIGQKLHWDEALLNILSYYLANKNIASSIIFLTSYNKLCEQNKSFQDQYSKYNKPLDKKSRDSN